MNTLLEKAFEEASKLPELEQNALAHWLIEEVLAERKWEATFAKSEPLLEKLAKEALAEHEQGKTEVLEPDRL